MAATALATLSSTQTGSAWVLALAGLTLLGSWVVEPESRWGRLFDRANLFFNLVIVALFGLAVLKVTRGFPEVDLTPFVDFILFLLAYKLCQRRSNRDYLQIYILSFLVMLAAAWQASGAVFIVGFVVYVVLATWTLILFHLRREIEENYLLRHAGDSSTERVTVTRVLNSRRVVGLRFFVTTGLVGLAVLAGAAAVFVMVPRVGLGFVLGGTRRPMGVVGFSDEVQLGLRGTLSSDNQTVVLRAEVPRIAAIRNEAERDQAISSLYWRGTVYDTYNHGEWIRSKTEATRTHIALFHAPSDDARTYVLMDPDAPGPVSRRAVMATADEQRIEVVALVHAVAFALDEPLAFEMPPPPSGSFVAVDFEPRWSGELGLRAFRVNPFLASDQRAALPDFIGARYRAYSRLGLKRPGVNAGSPQRRADPGALDSYLRVPVSLSPELRELARTLTAGRPNAAAKIQSVVSWLQGTHKYSTTLQRDERIEDPLEDFLFHQSAGHCEYFASAAAVLLRLGGVPTRYVNGFLGGEWNAIRQSITIRDNRAHSWAEAYVDDVGWVRVEATPAGGRTSRMSGLRQIMDAAELAWSRWVIDFSASQQLLLAKRIGQRLSWMQPSSGAWVTKRWTVGLAAAALIAVAWFLWRKRPRRRRSWLASRSGERPNTPVFEVYEKTLRRLALRGLQRYGHETPHEFAARATARGILGSGALARLTDIYTRARYGEAAVPSEMLDELRRAAETIALPPDQH